MQIPRDLPRCPASPIFEPFLSLFVFTSCPLTQLAFDPIFCETKVQWQSYVQDRGKSQDQDSGDGNGARIPT